MIALVALGNRLWGEEKASHAIGLALMATGLWLGYPVEALPMIMLGVLIWRAHTTKPWLELCSGGMWSKWVRASFRGLLVLPLGFIMAWYSVSMVPIYIASAAVFLVPACYWIGGMINRRLSVEIAELLAGGCVGSMSLNAFN